MRRQGFGRILAGRKEGQALVEFAIVLPLLLLLIVGIVELAAAWQTMQVITNAAREGARRAIVPMSTEAEVREALDTFLTSAGFDPDQAQVTLRCDGADGLCPGFSRSGRSTEVELVYPYTFRSLGPLLNLVCGGCGEGWGTIPLRSVTVMRNE